MAKWFGRAINADMLKELEEVKKGQKDRNSPLQKIMFFQAVIIYPLDIPDCANGAVILIFAMGFAIPFIEIYFR